jgi:hypothetical protein
MKVESRICDKCGDALDKKGIVPFSVRDGIIDEASMNVLDVELCPKCAGKELKEFYRVSTAAECRKYCDQIRENWKKFGWKG